MGRKSNKTLNKPTRQCLGITKKGTACGKWALRDETLCIIHSQSNTAHEHRAKGGRNSSNIERAKARIPAPLQKDFTELDRIASGIETGWLTPQQGNAITSTILAKLKIWEVGQDKLEAEEELQAIKVMIEHIQSTRERSVPIQSRTIEGTANTNNDYLEVKLKEHMDKEEIT
tara:strand:+ start:3065 stop:3583 length:519 start_codon:yes stop_codon:yes gene_type:complete